MTAACSRRDSDAARPAGTATATAPVVPPDPAVVLAGFRDRSAIPVELETSEGAVHCMLDGVRAPRAAALFVGLATGRASYRDPHTGATITGRSLYVGRAFFRAIPGAYVQTGCPLDDGTGHPGYRIPPEVTPGDAERLGRPGALAFASYTAPPNRDDPAPPPPGHTLGSQFIVTLGDMKHLAGKTTVLGVCEDLDIVRRIAARRPAAGAAVLRGVHVQP